MPCAAMLICKIGRCNGQDEVAADLADRAIAPCRIDVVTKEDALEFIQTAEQRQHDDEQQ